MLRFSQTQVSDFLWFHLLGLRMNLVGEELMFLSTDIARSHVRAQAFGFFEQIRNRPPFLRAWTRHRVQEVWDFFVYGSKGACDFGNVYLFLMNWLMKWLTLLMNCWWNDWRYALCLVGVMYYGHVGRYLLLPCWLFCVMTRLAVQV